MRNSDGFIHLLVQSDGNGTFIYKEKQGDFDIVGESKWEHQK